MTCSARTCEVYEQRNGSTSYVSTGRGTASSALGMYKHEVTLPRATGAVLRLLSLQLPSSLVVQSLQLLPPPDAGQHEAEYPMSIGSNNDQQAASSQKAQVAAVLQDLMASG